MMRARTRLQTHQENLLLVISDKIPSKQKGLSFSFRFFNYGFKLNRNSKNVIGKGTLSRCSVIRYYVMATRYYPTPRSGAEA